MSATDLASRQREAMTRLIVFLAMVGSLGIAGVMADASGVLALRQLLAGQPIDDVPLAAYQHRQQFTNVAQFALFLVTSATFLLWLALSYEGISRGQNGPVGPSIRWVLACWFVPIANLFEPLRVVRALWQRSQEVKNRGQTARKKMPALLTLWWLASLVAVGLSIYSVVLKNLGRTIQENLYTAWVMMAADAAAPVAAGLAMAVVLRIGALTAMESDVSSRTVRDR